MNIYTLEILKVLLSKNTYYSNSYEWLHTIKKLENKFHVSYIWGCSWNNEHLDMYQVNLAKEGTYKGCVSSSLYYDKEIEKMFLEVKVYNGDNFDGYRKDLRITYTLVITEWNDCFKPCVDSLLDERVNKFIEVREKRKQENLYRLARNSILKSFENIKMPTQNFSYPCVIKKEVENDVPYYSIQFCGMSEAFTECNTPAEIEKFAKEVLYLTLKGRIEDNLECPIPSEIEHHEFDSEKENEYLHRFIINDGMQRKIVNYRNLDIGE